MSILKKTMLTALSLSLTLTLSAQRLTREEYILTYKHLAAETMERYGIPASIVMAQALLESDNGNSRLAREANNHFGIKCGGGWPGETIAHDDDARGECFRVYGSAEDSFLDHGTFLDTSPRYDKLFELREDDYKAWARGLRECGYATDPRYAALLVELIEDNKLYLLDQGVEVGYADIRTEIPEVAAGGGRTVDADNYTVVVDRLTGRDLYFNRDVPYILTQTGDTFASIAREMRIGTRKLLKFNDLTREVDLLPGEGLYIGLKNRRSEGAPAVHVVQAGETLHTIAQRYALRLKNLARRNGLEPGAAVRAGQRINL